MKNGTVKWFNDQKGFGFICGEDGKDYFVHYKNILMNGRKTLEENQRDSFDTEDTDKGTRAINESVLED